MNFVHKLNTVLATVCQLQQCCWC